MVTSGNDLHDRRRCINEDKEKRDVNAVRSMRLLSSARIIFLVEGTHDYASLVRSDGSPLVSSIHDSRKNNRSQSILVFMSRNPSKAFSPGFFRRSRDEEMTARCIARTVDYLARLEHFICPRKGLCVWRHVDLNSCKKPHGPLDTPVETR